MIQLISLLHNAKMEGNRVKRNIHSVQYGNFPYTNNGADHSFHSSFFFFCYAYHTSYIVWFTSESFKFISISWLSRQRKNTFFCLSLGSFRYHDSSNGNWVIMYKQKPSRLPITTFKEDEKKKNNDLYAIIKFSNDCTLLITKAITLYAL